VLRTPLALLSIFSLALFTACNDTPAPAPIPTLEVSPLQILALAGDAATTLEAKVSNSNAAVLWTLEGAGTLSSFKGTVTKYTPPAELNAASSAKITVVLEGTKLSQVVNIGLKPKPAVVVIPTVGASMDVSKPIYAGDAKIRFSVSLNPLGPTPLSLKPRSLPAEESKVEWTLEGPGQLDPIKGAFTDYTLPVSVTSQTQVSVSAQYQGRISKVSFNVLPKPLAPTLTLSPSSGSFTAGATGTAFTATLLGSTEALSWTLTGIGTLSSTTGKTVTYTPPSSVSKTETATLTVRAGSLSQSATLTITPQPTLTISPSSATFTAGNAGQSFSATLENSSETINWSLEGVGKLSSTTGKTVIYTPPSSVTKEEVVKLSARAGIAINEVTVKVSPKALPIFTLSGSLDVLPTNPLTAYATLLTPQASNPPKEFGKTNIDINGKFSILLPAEEDFKLDATISSFTQGLRPDCSGNLISINSNSRLGFLQGIRVYIGLNNYTDYISVVGYGEFTDLIYSDSNTTLDGILQCAAPASHRPDSWIFNLVLKHGWNYVSIKRAIDGKDVISYSSVAPKSITYYKK